MRLLLVEDNRRLGSLTRTALQQEGFTVDLVANGLDAEAAVVTTAYQVVVLDLGLPDCDGMDVLKAIRLRDASLPVIVLTARDSTQSLIAGLNGGADDYMRKPFDMGELVARLRALLRRPGFALSQQMVEGNLVFDTSARDIKAGDTRLDLSRREAAVLELLLRSAGRVVSKTSLEDSIYGYSSEPGSNALEVLMHRLRRKLQAAGATIRIRTLRGIGYLLSADP